MIKSYRDLDVWQRSMAHAVDCYRATQTFPPSETYGSIIQVKKAASSVPANISEGHGRTTREFIHFLRISRASLNELETHLELARRLGYIDKNRARALMAESAGIGQMINGLRRALERRLQHP